MHQLQVLHLFTVSRSGSNSGLTPLEAPGAQAIGAIGIGICVALVAAIMLLDLVSVRKHFAFMRRNVNYGWRRVVSKLRPAKRQPQRRRTTVRRRSTARRTRSSSASAAAADKGERQRWDRREALGEQQTVTLKRTASGITGAGTFPVLAPRPARRQPLVKKTSSLGFGTTKSADGNFENSLKDYTNGRSYLQDEPDTKL